MWSINNFQFPMISLLTQEAHQEYLEGYEIFNYHPMARSFQVYLLQLHLVLALTYLKVAHSCSRVAQTGQVRAQTGKVQQVQMWNGGIYQKNGVSRIRLKYNFAVTHIDV